MRWRLFLFALVSCAQAQTIDADTSASGQTAFPAEYRSWRKLNSQPIIRDVEREARDLYANEIALTKQGNSFPVGSILVKEEKNLRIGTSGRLEPGDVMRISVMFKVGQGATTGWSFKAFDPNTREEIPRERVDPDGCYFCHADASARDYVFTEVKP